jgi:DNA-binding MarR family transcriptional regulator
MVLSMPEDVDPELPLAALLRAARATLGRAIRSALEAAGYDDLPANGPYVMSATSVAGVPLAAIIERLGLSKQAAGHLVDLLVLRGYLDRQVDPEDRRRLVVLPTDRGRAAAQVIREAADLLEADLVAAVGDAALRTTRRTLAFLATLDGDDA